MTDNQYKFMLLTGKYYPDEDIKFNNIVYYFNQHNEEDNRIYYEESTGYWKKYKYNENGNLTYCDDSNGDWNIINNRTVIKYGNYYD